MSRVLLLFFYKNFILTLMLFAYMHLNGYSGTSLFNPSVLIGYNVVFTTPPLIVLGIFDKDVNRGCEHLEKVYCYGPMAKFFNLKIFLMNVGHSIVHGIIILILMV